MLDQKAVRSRGVCIAITNVMFQATQLFFRTNRATCEEWLMRIRRSMMLIGLLIDQPAVTLRHASAMIGEMYTSGNTQVCIMVPFKVC